MNFKSKIICYQIIFIGMLFPFTDLIAQKKLFVSTDGDDNITYENNDINNPWASPEKVWMNALAGDTVFFRSGTYYITQTINTKYASGNGTSEAPIVFTNYQNEQVIISGDVGGGPIFVLEKSYNYIEGLTIKGGNFSGGSIEGSVIVVGWDNPADHFKITNSTIEVYQSNTYSNNASVRINSSACNYAEIRNCKIIGDGGTIGVQIFRTQGVIIDNNEFYNCGLGVYLKHSNALDADPNLTNKVTNNYFHELSREAIYGVFNYALIQNNLLINCGINFGDDGGMGDGYVGADYNTISHNTLYNSAIEFVYEGREEDPNKGCLHNVVKDNLIMNKCIYHNYDDIDADIQSDYNLYPDIQYIVQQNQINYSITDWQTQNSSDNNSIAGTPIFIGGSTPSAINDYTLTESSPGKNSASDGTDMGADISKIPGNSGNVTSIIKTNETLNSTILLSATPNPFKTNTRIILDIPSKNNYKIALMNLNGQELAQIYQGELSKGKHTFSYHAIDKNGTPLSSGIYFITVRAKGVFEQEKIIHIN